MFFRCCPSSLVLTRSRLWSQISRSVACSCQVEPLGERKQPRNRFIPGAIWSISTRELQMKAGKKTKPLVPRHERDRISSDFNLIYRSSLRYWISAGNAGLGILTTAIWGLSAYKISSMTVEALPTLEGLFVCGVPFVIIGMSYAWHLLTRSVVTRIYHNPDSDQFIAINRNFFGQLKQIDYTMDDISFKERKKESPDETWDSVTLRIKDRPVFLISSDFAEMSFYNMHVSGETLLDRSTLVKDHFH